MLINNTNPKPPINYMIKTQLSPSSQTVCLSHRNYSSLKYSKSKLVLKPADCNSIASIREAEERIKDLEKKHKWRRERRLQKLHDTYDENCRLYMSINSQKSIYALYRHKNDTISLEKRNRQGILKSRRYDNDKETPKNQEWPHKKVDEYRLNVKQVLNEFQSFNRMDKLEKSADNPVKKYLTENTPNPKIPTKIVQKYFIRSKNNPAKDQQNPSQNRISLQTQPLKRAYKFQVGFVNNKNI